MKKLTLFLTTLMCLNGAAFAAIDWESKGMQMAGEIVANPSAFFYDFQQDMETTTPLPPGKTVSVQTGIFPTILPMTNLNLSGKYRLHGEGRLAPGVPQVDLMGGYGDMYGARMVAKNSDSIEKAKLNGYYLGAILSSSVSPKIRTFWGYKRSVLKAKFEFAEGKELDLMGTKISNVDTGFKDDFLMAGIETPKGVNKFWSIQLNYGVRTQTFSTKLSWYGPHFELGLNFYPEGVLVFHPVWNYHINF
jgi:hypothetical protein